MYFSYYEKGTQTLPNLLGSILSQILYNVPSVPEELQESYRGRRSNGRSRSRTSSEHLESIRLITERLPRIFIVLDALDECSEEVRQQFLEAILSLQPKVQLFVTSRFFTSMLAELGDCESLEVSAKESDMERYLSMRLSEEKQLQRIVQTDSCLEQSLVATIIKRSRGMWVNGPLFRT